MGFKTTISNFSNKVKQSKICLIFATIYAFVWSVGKILFGAFSAGYFFCVSGASSLLFAFVKKIYLSNCKNDNEQEKRGKSITISILIICSGVLFTFYMARLFFIDDVKHYDIIWSITIAAASFFELGLSIFNLHRAKKSKDILLQSFRGYSVASSCYAIVLTQVALLSATNTPTASANFYNALTGVILGGVAVLIGVVLLIISCQKKIVNLPLTDNGEEIETKTENE